MFFLRGVYSTSTGVLARKPVVMTILMPSFKGCSQNCYKQPVESHFDLELLSISKLVSHVILSLYHDLITVSCDPLLQVMYDI